MRRIINVEKEIANSVSVDAAGTLFSISGQKSRPILPEEALTSEVQALLDHAVRVIECETGGHGRRVNGEWSRCPCHNH